MNSNYKNPDKNIMAKYGLKKIKSNDKMFKEYRGRYHTAPHIKIELSFCNGMITLEEYHRLPINKAKNKFETVKRIRLFRVYVDNDNELDILLRQTFPDFWN